jgi:hypothetical protein
MFTYIVFVFVFVFYCRSSTAIKRSYLFSSRNTDIMFGERYTL